MCRGRPDRVTVTSAAGPGRAYRAFFAVATLSTGIQVLLPIIGHAGFAFAHPGSGVQVGARPVRGGAVALVRMELGSRPAHAGGRLGAGSRSF